MDRCVNITGGQRDCKMAVLVTTDLCGACLSGVILVLRHFKSKLFPALFVF